MADNNKRSLGSKSISKLTSKAKVTIDKKTVSTKHVDRPTVTEKATKVILSKSEEMPSTSRAAQQRMRDNDLNLNNKLNSILNILEEDIEKNEKNESKEPAPKKKPPVQRPNKPIPIKKKPNVKAPKAAKVKKAQVKQKFSKRTSFGSVGGKLMPVGGIATKTTLQHRMAFLSTVNKYIFSKQYKTNGYTPALKKSPLKKPTFKKTTKPSPRFKKVQNKNVTKAKKTTTNAKPIAKKAAKKVITKKQNTGKKSLPKKPAVKKAAVVKKPLEKTIKNPVTNPIKKLVNKPAPRKMPIKTQQVVVRKPVPKKPGKLRGFVAKNFDSQVKDPGLEKRTSIRSRLNLDKAEAELKVYQQRVDERKAIAMRLEQARGIKNGRDMKVDFPLMSSEMKHKNARQVVEDVINGMSEYPPIYNKRKDPNSERKYILL